MSKTISIIRIAVLTALSAIAMLLIFGEEQDQHPLQFLIHLVADKALGIALVIIASRLHRRWSKTDPWLRAAAK